MGEDMGPWLVEMMSVLQTLARRTHEYLGAKKRTFFGVNDLSGRGSIYIEDIAICSKVAMSTSHQVQNASPTFSEN